VARFPPGIDQTPQVPDVSGGVAVLQTKTGQCPFSTTLGGAGQEFIKIVRPQVQDVGLLTNRLFSGIF
jgi:hypothetical protein